MLTRSFFLAAVLLASLLMACGGPSTPEMVTVAIELPPTNLDPRVGTDAISEHMFELIFSSLVHRTPSMELEPDLVIDADAVEVVYLMPMEGWLDTAGLAHRLCLGRGRNVATR